MNRSIAPVILAGLMLSGCASSLRVHQDTAPDDEGRLPGVPFATVEPWIKTGFRDAHTEAGTACNRVQFHEIVQLPTGPRYFINVSSAPLAKTSLTVSLGNDGALTSVGLNTEPVAINAATDALATLLPFADITPTPTPSPPLAPPPLAEEPAPPRGEQDRACNTGEAGVRMERFSDFLRRTGR